MTQSPNSQNSVHKKAILENLSDQKNSALQKYVDFFVGREGILSLLKFELINSLMGPMPGAPGFLLRKLFFPKLMKSVGRGVNFGRNVTMRHPGKIQIGDHTAIDDNCLLDAKGVSNDGISIGSGVFIGRNSILSCKNGNIKLGRNVNVGFNCEIFSGSNVEIGDDVLIAAYCYLVGGDHDAGNIDDSISSQGSTSYGIKVGQGSWFGAGVKVLDGRTIGSHCILGAGAVVTTNIQDYAVVAGVPARIIRDRRIKR